MPVVRHEVTVTNRLGLHARAAMMLSETAKRFNCRIHIRKGDRDADGASILEIMQLAGVLGDLLVFEADGEQAEAAIAALRELVERKFGEE